MLKHYTSKFARPALCLFLLGCMLFPATAQARPNAMRIFPKETIGFVRVRHAKEYADKVMASSLGEIRNDPELKPFIDHILNYAKKKFNEEVVDKELGLDLTFDQFANMPQGEIALGLIARKKGVPTFALLLDLGEDSDAAHKFLDKMLEMAEDNGIAREVETVGELELTVLDTGDDKYPQIALIEKENTLLVVADLSLAKSMLALWEAAETGVPIPVEEPAKKDEGSNVSAEPFWVKSLAENQKFVSIMQECRTKGDVPPDILFYADPVDIFRNFAREQVGMAIAVAMLPSLGLDGLQGIGGSGTMSTEQLEDISHIHILLDNPRAGVLAALNPKTGDMKAEPFVPNNVDTYMTVHWDAPLTLEKIESMFDQFQGEGFFKKQVAGGFNKEFEDLDFHEDLIGQMEGRISLLLAFPEKNVLGQRWMLFAVKVKDEDAAKKTMETIIKKEVDREQTKKEKFGEVEYWYRDFSWQKETPIEDRPFSPCFAIMDGYFVFSTTVSMLQRCIEARDGTRDRLVDSLDYKLVSSRIRGQSKEPTGIMINRPEEAFRFFYRLLTSEETLEKLEEQAERNEFFQVVQEALEEHPLPPFESIAKYLAPSCGVMTDTPTGIHFTILGLKRKPAEAKEE